MSTPTDDSIMTLAVAKAIMESKPDYSDLSENTVKYMQEIGRHYPNCGYGARFWSFIFNDNPKPYRSYGNGAAMRVSPAGFAARSLEDAKTLSRKVTEVSHDHPEGIKGAEATAVAVYMARIEGTKKENIKEYIKANYYDIDFTLDEIRDTYEFNETCQETVPQALEAFFESEDYEDAIRNAISIGGDSDTVAAICGGVASAYYGVPTRIRARAMEYLNEEQREILEEFEAKYER